MRDKEAYDKLWSRTLRDCALSVNGRPADAGGDIEGLRRDVLRLCPVCRGGIDVCCVRPQPESQCGRMEPVRQPLIGQRRSEELGMQDLLDNLNLLYQQVERGRKRQS